MPPPHVPLYVKSRVLVGYDRLMITIDHELEKTELHLPVCSCDVALSGSDQFGFHAEVAIELEGGRCISQNGAATDLASAIHQAFVACRVLGSASE